MIIQTIIIVVFFLLGVLFSGGKGANLIVRYNTMTEEEKQKYNAESLNKFMAQMMFVLSFIMLFWLASVAIENDILLYIGIFLFIGAIVFMIIFVNKSDKFKADERK